MLSAFERFIYLNFHNGAVHFRRVPNRLGSSGIE
jgi:hypothetical protein